MSEICFKDILPFKSFFRNPINDNSLQAPHAMGKIAAVAQNAGIFGGIYQIVSSFLSLHHAHLLVFSIWCRWYNLWFIQKSVLDKKTTEYMPSSMQFGILFILIQWTIFGLLSGNMYMVVSYLESFSLIINLIAYLHSIIEFIVRPLESPVSSFPSSQFLSTSSILPSHGGFQFSAHNKHLKRRMNKFRPISHKLWISILRIFSCFYFKLFK